MLDFTKKDLYKNEKRKMDRFLRDKLILETERQEEEFNNAGDDLGVIDTGSFEEGDAFDLGASDDSDFFGDGDDIDSFGAAGDRSGVKGDVAWKKDKWYLTFLLAPVYMTKYIFVDMTEDFPKGKEWKGIVKALNTINIICIITALLALIVGLQTIFTPSTQIIVGLILFSLTTVITKYGFKEDTKTISIFKRILGIGEGNEEDTEDDDLLNFDFGDGDTEGSGDSEDTGFEFGSIEHTLGVDDEDEDEFIEQDIEVEDEYVLEDSPITIKTDEEFNQTLLEVFAENSEYVGKKIHTRLDMVKSFGKYLIQNDKSFGKWKRPKERGVEFNNLAYAMYKCICRIDNAFSSYTPTNEDEEIDKLVIRDIRKSPLLYRIEMELPDRIRLRKFQSNIAEIEDMLRKTEDDVNVNVLVSTFQGSIVVKLLRMDNNQMVSLGDILRFTDEDRGNIGMKEFEDEGQGLPILIGLKNNEYPFVLDFESNSNGVIVGGSGSGKSWTTFEMMLNIIVTNDYNNVNFIVLDGKNAPFWGGFARLPHVLGFHHDVKDFIDVLYEVEAEREARQEKLKTLGVEDVQGYREALREQGRYEELKEMPLLIVVIDEITSTMQTLKSEDEEMYKELQSILIQITTRGRSAGIRLLLIGQRSINESIPKTVMGNSSFKFGMKMEVASDFERMFDTDARNIKKPDAKGMGLLKTEEVGPIQSIKTLTLGGKNSSQIISLIRVLGFEWVRRSIGNGDDVEKLPDIYNFNLAYNRNMFYHYTKEELKEGRLINEVEVSKGYELDLDELKERFSGKSRYDYGDDVEDARYEEVEDDDVDEVGEFESEDEELDGIDTEDEDSLVEDDEAPLFGKKDKVVVEEEEIEEDESLEDEMEIEDDDTFSWQDLQKQIFSEDDEEEESEINERDEIEESKYLEEDENGEDEYSEIDNGLEIEEIKEHEEVEIEDSETESGTERLESKEDALTQNEGGLSIEDLLEQSDKQEKDSEESSEEEREEEGTLSEQNGNKSEDWSEQLGKQSENNENNVKNTENTSEEKSNESELEVEEIEVEREEVETVEEKEEERESPEGMELDFGTANTSLTEPKRSVKSYVIEHGTLKGFNAYISKAELETVYTRRKIEESLDRVLIVEKGDYYIAKM